MKKVLAFPLVRILLILVPFFVVIIAVGAVVGRHRGPWTSVLISSIGVVVLTLSIAGIERATTGRFPAEIGFDPHRIAGDTLKGLALGAALFSAVALELALTGHYRIVAIHATSNLWTAAVVFIVGAMLEELLFRGVLFRLIDEMAGLWVALGVSAIFFGAVHAFNPGATWVSSLAIAVEAGVLLGAAFALTKNIWFPIGVHFAWNFCEGPIYGTQVSGGVVAGSLITAQIAGPNWLTGGAFGPEAGAPAVVTCLIVAVALLVRVRERSKITPERVESAAP